MRLTFLSIFIFLSFAALSQVKVSGQATGKHASALNRGKEAKQQAKARRQEAKEIRKKVKEQEKARKLYKKRFVELKEQRLDSLNQFDSLQVTKLPISDSLALAYEVLEQPDFPQEYREYIENPVSFTQPSLENGDSLALARGSSFAEQTAKEFVPDELQAPTDPMQGITNPAQGGMGVPGVGNPTQKVNRPNPNLVKPDVAQALFKKIDPEQFKDAQANVQKLKKKYSEMPDTRYPEKGIKRNSLEKVPFKKRLYVGGNISLQSTDPLILDMNLQLGYWINKKWLTGVGLIVREQFSQQDSAALVSGDGHGFSVFTRYDIAKSFFFWGEGEWQVNRSVFGNENQAIQSEWQQAYMMGIGRDFSIGPVKMMSMILYDFNYQDNDLRRRPWVFKMGFRISKRP